MLSVEESSVSFLELCRANGWKRTAQRRAVFDCLRGGEDHPSVEAVWRQVRETLPDVSLDSIYRILDEFAEAGLARRLENGRVIRYDANLADHDHFVCSVCGRMYDFLFPRTNLPSEACKELGVVTSVEVSVRGVCNACRGVAWLKE